MPHRTIGPMLDVASSTMLPSRRTPRRHALPPGWWGPRGGGSRGHSIVELLAQRVLDAELAALVWLLLEARVPLVVAGEASRVGKTTLLTALLEFLPPEARAIPLAGAMEDFGWLPEAPELGWRLLPAEAAGRADRLPVATPASDVLLVAELSDHLPTYTWGPHARIAVRALSLGYGLAATIHADRLEDVFDRLRAAPVHLSDDELSRLGVVLVMRRVEAPREREPMRRVVAAHYIRPVARDEHGHVQRLPPAVLAAYEPRRDELEHFAWGVMPELAARLGRRSGELELEQRRRAEYLAGLVASGVHDPAAVALAIAGYRGIRGDILS